VSQNFLRIIEETITDFCEFSPHSSMLNSILSSPISRDPSSPSSASTTSYATSLADDSSDPSPPTPSTLVEFKLLSLLLSSLSSPSSALPIILRDPPADSASKNKTPCVSMNQLKVELGGFARGKGWTEGMGTTAIYSLISKQVGRIDRRGKEGAAVGFKV